MGTENYVIKRRMFVKYEGPEVEVLEIPEGVTNCKEGSFWESREQLRNCKKIIIPSTVNALKTMAKWVTKQLQ